MYQVADLYPFFVNVLWFHTGSSFFTTTNFAEKIAIFALTLVMAELDSLL
jgi:hypothetical protein